MIMGSAEIVDQLVADHYLGRALLAPVSAASVVAYLVLRVGERVHHVLQEYLSRSETCVLVHHGDSLGTVYNLLYVVLGFGPLGASGLDRFFIFGLVLRNVFDNCSY